MNFVYPNYAWIFLGAYSEDWWRAELGSDIRCTSEQMLAVVNRSLVVQQFPIIEDTDEKAIGNLVSTTCKCRYIHVCVAVIDPAFACWVCTCNYV